MSFTSKFREYFYRKQLLSKIRKVVDYEHNLSKCSTKQLENIINFDYSIESMIKILETKDIKVVNKIDDVAGLKLLERVQRFGG